MDLFYNPANFVYGGKTVFTLSVRVCVRRAVCNVLLPKYLEESWLDFHHTLQTCSYMQDKYFKQKVRARGPILSELFPFVDLNGFYIGFYAYAIIVHTRADQLLPQLLMEQFDTLPIQCRHIEHMQNGVWFRKK